MATVSSSRRVRARNVIANAIVVIVCILVLIRSLVAVNSALVISMRNSADVFGAKRTPFLRFIRTLDYWDRLANDREFRLGMTNSTIIAGGAATLALILGTPAAYGLARFRYIRPRNGSWMTWFLSQRVLPPVIFITPFFLIIRQL